MMTDMLRDPNWSPYVAGVGIGVLSWLAFFFSDHPLGISSAFAKTSGLIEKAVRSPWLVILPATAIIALVLLVLEGTGL